MVSVIAISCIASASQRPQRCNSRRDGCIYEQSGCGDNHSVTGTDNIQSVVYAVRIKASSRCVTNSPYPEDVH